MNTYKIKVTSPGQVNRGIQKKWEASAKNKSYSFNLKIFIKPTSNLKMDKSKINGKTYIVNRYEVHKLIDWLLKDDKSTQRIKGSYYVLNKKIVAKGKFKECSSISSYVVLKTDQDICKKMEEINTEYIKVSGRKKFKPEHKPVKFIKELGENYKLTDKMILKKSSPVVLKSTIKQILESQDEFYKKIYEELNLNEEQLDNMYQAKQLGKKARNGKNIYFLPDCLKKYERANTPVVFVPEELYFKMLLKTLNLETKPNKQYKISEDRGISVIKVNKPVKEKECIFNVIGAAITIQTNDEEFKKNANIYGLGHMTNYGFGFMFTEDKPVSTLKQREKTNTNKPNSKKKDVHSFGKEASGNPFGKFLNEK